MAGVPRFYKNNIAEGKGILVFAILIAVALRIVYFLNFDYYPVPPSDGYLWQPLVSLFSIPLISLLTATAFVAALAATVAHINTSFVLIRTRTVLPSAMILMVFSSHPSFIYMSPAYVGVLTLFFLIAVLFSSYNRSESPQIAFRVSFILALGGLFVPILLIYLPVMWLGLAIMRCFSFRSVLASFFGLFIVYFPVFSFYFFTENLQTFIKPFVYNIDPLANLPLFNLSGIVWGIIGVWVFLLILIIGDNYINRYKDKVRIRICLSLLSFITVIAFLLYLFLYVSPDVNLYIMIGTGAILLSHFFALAERKITVVLFYVYLVVYAAICTLPFFSVL